VTARRHRLGTVSSSLRAADLRLAPGPVDLTAIDSGATPGVDLGKKKGKAALLALGDGLSDLQERLYAEGVADVGHGRAVLLVLQGMDTSGKGGTLRHTVGLVDPQGLRISSFKKPTEEELAQDFLWRIRKVLPTKGIIGVFDRSHYEDVLVVRVHELVPAEEIERRYDAINEFEAELAASGITVVKCMLHISAQTQKERLLARLDDPTKYWKFNPADIDERAHWPAYREAYEIALERTNTEVAPWYVIPSDHKWYRNLAIGQLLHETLTNMNPQWPSADFDVEEQKRRLTEEVPVQ
jgi:PPK2 family polyphosphate:nucleotide phosphotransferase